MKACSWAAKPAPATSGTTRIDNPPDSENVINSLIIIICVGGYSPTVPCKGRGEWPVAKSAAADEYKVNLNILGTAVREDSGASFLESVAKQC